jgi:hypothetical protein
MKKAIAILSLSLLITSCNNQSKQIDIVKADIKKKGNISEAEIETMKFNTMELISVDGKNDLMKISNDRKMKVIKNGGVYGFFFDICKENEIKENDKVLKVEAYRIVTDTVYKSIYFINGEKIVGRFSIK